MWFKEVWFGGLQCFVHFGMYGDSESCLRITARYREDVFNKVLRKYKAGSEEEKRAIFEVVDKSFIRKYCLKSFKEFAEIMEKKYGEPIRESTT